MRLGLIGTGKQGQRYLQEKNGGRHIKVSGSRRIPLDDIDGGIIATHPAGHKELALEAIAAGKHVLIEKPLALNLRDCMDVIDKAERWGVVLDVAHQDLFSNEWDPIEGSGYVMARAEYKSHDRDYSPWLDWAPHCLALLAHAMPDANERELRRATSVSTSGLGINYLEVRAQGWSYVRNNNLTWPTPMERMVLAFMAMAERAVDILPTRRPIAPYGLNRRIYRALFAEE